MPTYVYKCDSCGAQFEKIQSFKDDPIRVCPVCSQPVRKVFQPVGIVFKGSGWYVTDSRKTSSATVDGKDDVKDDKAETKTDAASETKSEPTTETKPDAPSTPAPSAPAATPAPSTAAPSTT